MDKLFVGPVGPRDAKIMIVGEAPNVGEAKAGKPFQAKRGDLLTECLSRAGILRQDCYITNVVKERPDRNDIGNFIRFSRGKRTLVTAAYVEYVKMLQEEIINVNPNVIVAVGDVALNALCDTYKVSSYRGSVLESTLVPGKKVIPIIPPEDALIQYENRHLITLDLRKVNKESATPRIGGRDRNYIIRPSFDQSVAYLEGIKTSDLIGSDIECSRGTVSCISFSTDPSEAISIPFYTGGHNFYTRDQEMYLWRLINKVLSDPRYTVVFQNAAFDTSYLLRTFKLWCRNVEDTMLAFQILYPDFPKGLDMITSVYTDIPYYKDEGRSVMKDQLRGYVNDEEAFWRYNAKDSIVLVEAFPKMVQELIRAGNYEAYKRQVGLLQPLLFMMEYGIKVDLEGKALASVEAGRTVEDLEAQLHKVVGFELNPRSPKQLQDYFYGALKLKPYIWKGKPSVNAKALTQIARKRGKGSQAASLILQSRKVGKEKGTYYDMKLDEDGRLRAQFSPAGTSSGRLSSRKTVFETGANLQNQPPAMKKLLLIDDGFIGYEIDLSQAENRIVAYLGPDHAMIDAFEQGIDIHSLTASLIFRIPLDEIVDMDKEGVKCEVGGGAYTHRFWGKKANHGLNYDLSARSFGLYYEIPESEAKVIVNAYHKAYPGVRAFHRWVQRELREDRTLTNMFGRRRRYAGRWGNDLYKEAYSFVPQSTVAEMTNQWGFRHIYDDQETYKPIALLVTVHDSVAFQIPKSVPMLEHASMIQKIRRSLEQTLDYKGFEISIPTDLTVKPVNLKDGYEVKAKAVPATASDEVMEAAITSALANHAAA